MDTIVVIHFALQVAVWGVLFPTGMVLGLTRSRWHVPLQSAGYLLTTGGYIFGATRRGPEDALGTHGALAHLLLAPILLQLTLGVYLQLRINARSLRPYILRLHGIVGKAYPVLAWIQMLAGAARLGGYCQDDHLAQCLAHYSLGSSLIAYGVIMAIMFLAGNTWVRRSGRSPDFFDSCVMTAYGIFNTFTMHAGGKWDIHDYQHTAIGVVWWAGGILGMLLSRNNTRSVVPSVILIITGWSMGEHAQHLELSTKVHAMFGRTLIMAGVTRIIEVCYFVPMFKPLPKPDLPVDDASSEHTLAESSPCSVKEESEDDEKAMKRAAGRVWRHLPPFLYVASGIFLMSATDDELESATEKGVDHVSYILIMFSFAFLIYALAVFLIHLYQTSGRHREELTSSPVSLSTFIGEPSTPGVLELAATPTTASTPRSWRKWYASTQGHDNQGDRRPQPIHVLGEDDSDEEDMREVETETARLYSVPGLRV